MVALALCTLGNICSSEMARDLTPDVERIMRNGPAYLKKKATLCASRIIRKEPELIENFLPIISSLLNDKHHGVMLSGVALVTEMCNMSPVRVFIENLSLNNFPNNSIFYYDSFSVTKSS